MAGARFPPRQRISIFAEALRLAWWSRPQTYLFRYRLKLPQGLPAPPAFTVVCPLPRTLEYQAVTDLRFQATPDGVGEELQYGNRFAWWRVAVPLGHGALPGYDATVAVRPRLTNAAAGLRIPATSLPGDDYLEATDAVQAIAARLSYGISDRHTYISRCYEHVVANLRYGNPIAGLYRASDALELPAVDCGGFDALLGALLLARGIPARLVSGFWAGYPDAGMHAWLECESAPGSWAPLDPSVDHLYRRGRSRKSGRQYFVGSDRIALSVGADLQLTLAGQPVRVAMLQHPYGIGNFSAPLLADVSADRL